jgi:hypothetical protein
MLDFNVLLSRPKREAGRMPALPAVNNLFYFRITPDFSFLLSSLVI